MCIMENVYYVYATYFLICCIRKYTFWYNIKLRGSGRAGAKKSRKVGGSRSGMLRSGGSAGKTGSGVGGSGFECGWCLGVGAGRSRFLPCRGNRGQAPRNVIVYSGQHDPKGLGDCWLAGCRGSLIICVFSHRTTSRKLLGKRCSFTQVSDVGHDEVLKLKKRGFLNHKCPARVSIAYALVA